MRVLTEVHALRSPTFRQLLERVPDRGLALATLWLLIARGELCADLSIPITLESVLYPR